MFRVNKFSMGMTAAIMTSMALIAGLAQGENSSVGIIAGLFIIAVADNISDSFSIHMYFESEGASREAVRTSTFGNFAARFVLVLTFALIVYLFPPSLAFIFASLWGLILLTALSYRIAAHRKKNPLSHTAWHVFVAVAIIACSKILGGFILRFAS